VKEISVLLVKVLMEVAVKYSTVTETLSCMMIMLSKRPLMASVALVSSTGRFPIV
jgi:hypothetical protein